MVHLNTYTTRKPVLWKDLNQRHKLHLFKMGMQEQWLFHLWQTSHYHLRLLQNFYDLLKN